MGSSTKVGSSFIDSFIGSLNYWLVHSFNAILLHFISHSFPFVLVRFISIQFIHNFLSFVSFHFVSFHAISSHIIYSSHVISFHVISYPLLLFHSFHSIPFHSIPFHSIPFIRFHSIRFHSIWIHFIPFISFHFISCHFISCHVNHSVTDSLIHSVVDSLKKCGSLIESLTHSLHWFIDRLFPSLTPSHWVSGISTFATQRCSFVDTPHSFPHSVPDPCQKKHSSIYIYIYVCIYIYAIDFCPAGHWPAHFLVTLWYSAATDDHPQPWWHPWMAIAHPKKGMTRGGEWIVDEKKTFMFMNILWARNCTYIYILLYIYIYLLYI